MANVNYSRMQQLTFTCSLKKIQAHPDGPLQQRNSTMLELMNTTAQTPRREPWERGQIDRREAPSPAQAREVDPRRLQMAGRTRDLAMFNLGY
jgi:hypothetical protein